MNHVPPRSHLQWASLKLTPIVRGFLNSIARANLTKFVYIQLCRWSLNVYSTHVNRLLKSYIASTPPMNIVENAVYYMLLHQQHSFLVSSAPSIFDEKQFFFQLHCYLEIVSFWSSCCRLNAFNEVLIELMRALWLACPCCKFYIYALVGNMRIYDIPIVIIKSLKAPCSNTSVAAEHIIFARKNRQI